MIESPSRELRTAVVERLSDEAIGLNPYLAEAATEYEVDPFEIDFSDTSDNFYKSNINPRQMPDITDFDFPILCVYASKGENTGSRAISAAFDGEVLVCVDVHLSWDGLASLRDFESRLDAVEAALVSSLNIQLHPEGLAYTSYAFVRTPLSPAGSRWIASISLRITTQVTES
jgi:hypothetical protein